MRQFLAAEKGESEAGGIAQDIADAVAKVRDHPQWRKDYMLFELKMRDAKEEGLAEGRAEGLREGRAEVRQDDVEKIALFIMAEHPEMEYEEALKMASEILK